MAETSHNTTVWYADLRPGDSGTPPSVSSMCSLCWSSEVIERRGSWWLQHIGPLDECTHSCHDDTFLGSTS